MIIDLSEEDLKVVLDSLIEGIAFESDSNELKSVYNLIVTQCKFEDYSKIR